MVKTLVLLSGGLDSTAALLWALKGGEDVSTLFLYYGQPASTPEIRRAIAVTQELGVPFHRSDISGAFYGVSTGLFQPVPAGMQGYVDRAFVPARNPVLLSVAAARALCLWRDANVRLVTGFNLDDVRGFPDCSEAFVSAFQDTIDLGIGEKRLEVVTPWSKSSKAEVLGWVRANAPEHQALIDASWSCYRPEGPCGECTACVTRARAYAGG